MKDRRQYDIDIYGLSNQNHDYGFKIESSFFKLFENSLVETGNLDVKLTLDKSETMIQATFLIKGTIELTCDRSLEKFDEKVDLTEHLIFKYADEYQEVTEDIITIPRETHQLNVAQYIYEFIGLSIPMKKLHPKFREQDEMEDAESILIYTTKGNEDNNDKEEEIDPRWDILNKLKKNNN